MKGSGYQVHGTNTIRSFFLNITFCQKLRSQFSVKFLKTNCIVITTAAQLLIWHTVVTPLNFSGALKKMYPAGTAIMLQLS